MSGRVGLLIVSIGLFLFVGSCLDPYYAPHRPADSTTLVVDGFLNATEGSVQVILNRSIPVESFGPLRPEMYATLKLIDQNGTSYPLGEATPGIYQASNLTLGKGDSVHLKITTIDYIEYESTVVPVLEVSAIDSITWESKREGLSIKANAHGASENRYYYWKYVETWNHTAGYETAITLDASQNIVPLAEDIYECWTTERSSNILVRAASLQNSGGSVVAGFQLATLPWESPKLQSHYSMEIEQHAITREAFDFYEELRKNTENLGTLFDPLPSSPVGNIHCINYPKQVVAGNFAASTIAKERIFLSEPDWTRAAGTRSVTGNEGCFLAEYRNKSDLFTFVPVGKGVGLPFQLTTPFCIDCRLNGGSNVRPDFWIW